MGENHGCPEKILGVAFESLWIEGLSMVENINDLKLDRHTNHVLIAINKIFHGLDWKNLDKFLQISSVSDFEKTPISQVFLNL